MSAMSRLKKHVPSFYFAATAGAAALAIVLTPTFDRFCGTAVGQNTNAPAAPTTEAPTTSTVPAVAPVPAAPASSSSVSPISNPNPLGIGSDSVSSLSLGTLRTTGTAETAPNSNWSIATSDAPPAPDAANLNALRARAQQLQNELRGVPTSADEQEAQRRVVAELSALQTQIQQLEANAGQFAAFRRARDAQTQANGSNPLAAGYDGIGANAALGANPFDRQAALDASGLNGGAPASLSDPTAALSGAATFAPGEAEMLRRQKETLTQQYRQLQQTLRALQPGDAALAENLKQEQTSLLSQLKEIEARLANAPAAENSAFSANSTAIPPANALGGTLALDLNAGTDAATKTQKANRAAALLREAGLVGLANCVANEVPRLGNADFVETPLVPGAWAEGSGLAEERSNPFQQISAQDVQTIRTSIDDLKTRVDSLSETLKNVETQLKLLTRQTVDATASTPASTTEAETAPATPDESKSSAPEENAESLGEIGGSL